MNAKHTPGPWQVIDTTVYVLEHYGWEKGVEQLCNRFTVSINGRSTTSPDELLANAKLIAAAPELLTELVHAFNTISVNCGDSVQTQRIKALIAKATGEQA